MLLKIMVLIYSFFSIKSCDNVALSWQLGVLAAIFIFCSMSADEEDDMYDFTPADYYRVLGPKKQGTLAFNYLFIHSRR